MDSQTITWIVIGFLAVTALGCALRLIQVAIQYKNLLRKFVRAEAALKQEEKQRKQLQQEHDQLKLNLETAILVDPLTNLPSRKVFEDRLEQAFNQSKRYNLLFAVMELDIDEFRIIDNVLGPEVAEALIKEVVVRIQECVRKVDTIAYVAHERFLLLLPQIAKPEAVAYVAQRLLDSIAQPFRVMGQELFITACLGISIYPNDGANEKQILKNADTALYRAKSRGNSVYQFYQQEIHTTSKRQLLLSSRLRSAGVFQELTIYYQPQVNVETKKIIGMEAFLRWNHPDFGLITPTEFLRLAESNGTIVPIGDWVLTNACEQFIKWNAGGMGIQSISVNVSLRQLENPHFVHKISQVLHDTKMAPASLMLEISESVLLPKLDLVEKTLNMLRHLGVKIAIDDFGTGHLSLQHLRSFPVDYLKIDGVLIHDIATDPEVLAIIRMVIGLAENLNLKAVAEAVETLKQKEILHSHGCYLMQGHLFCSPMLPEEFNESLLASITEQV